MPTFSRMHMLVTTAKSGDRAVGEATDEKYRGQIQLESISWDMARKKDGESGNIRSDPEPGELDVSKLMDASSTTMLTHMKNGERLSVVCTLDSADSGFVLTITLNQARITQYKIDVKDDDKSGEVKEDWSFTYNAILLEYENVGAATLETEHTRNPEAGSNSEAKSIVASFKALKDDQMKIEVITKLKEDPDTKKFF